MFCIRVDARALYDTALADAASAVRLPTCNINCKSFNSPRGGAWNAPLVAALHRRVEGGEREREGQMSKVITEANDQSG